MLIFVFACSFSPCLSLRAQQKASGFDKERGHDMVSTVKNDLKKNYYDPSFHGMDLDALQPDLAAHPSIQHLIHIPEELRRVFVTAHDVSPEHHVRMQAVFQRYSDSGVSKTINLPATATKAEVAAAFLLAYQLGCKGLTVYRTGSRERQVFSCSPSHPC